MAELITVNRVDDIDGSADAEKHLFGFGGDNYEIDLSQKNADKLAEALAPFIEKATKVRKVKSGKPGRRASAASQHSSEQLAEIRAWGKANGYEVKERGRVSADVIEAFEAAHVASAKAAKPAKAEKSDKSDKSSKSDA